jgi:peptidoglycan/xylan/chitin deacetylase (PgdA/CDA1 family)
MYHSVGGKAYGDDRDMYSTDVPVFKAQMDLLLRYSKVPVVSLDDNPLYFDKGGLALTFDDGYADNLNHAAPILCSLGLPFTVFVTAMFVKEKRAGFLTPHTLRELSVLPGVVIGSHGWSHLSLAECDTSTVYKELSSSKRFLEDIIGKRVEAVSFPNGSTSNVVANIASTVGYSLGATSRPGINRIECERMFLRRTEINRRDTLRVFREKVSGAWDWSGSDLIWERHKNFQGF